MASPTGELSERQHGFSIVRHGLGNLGPSVKAAHGLSLTRHLVIVSHRHSEVHHSLVQRDLASGTSSFLGTRRGQLNEHVAVHLENLDEIPLGNHYKQDGPGLAFHELAAVTLA